MLTIEKRDDNTIGTLQVNRVDAANSPQIHKETDEKLPKDTHVILDLSSVKFMDSTGLGWLLELARTTQARGKKLLVCAPSPSVKTLFKLVRLTRVISIFDSLDEALQQPDQ